MGAAGRGASQTETEVDGAVPESVQYAWSSDGRVLFHMLGGRLSAPVSDDLFGVETFALRPLDP